MTSIAVSKPGVSTKALSATRVAVLLGVTIFLAFLIIMLNFLTDVLYKVMDPRIDLR